MPPASLTLSDNPQTQGYRGGPDDGSFDAVLPNPNPVYDDAQALLARNEPFEHDVSGISEVPVESLPVKSVQPVETAGAAPAHNIVPDYPQTALPRKEADGTMTTVPAADVPYYIGPDTPIPEPAFSFVPEILTPSSDPTNAVPSLVEPAVIAAAQPGVQSPLPVVTTKTTPPAAENKENAQTTGSAGFGPDYVDPSLFEPGAVIVEASRPIYDEETGVWVMPEENAQSTGSAGFGPDYVDPSLLEPGASIAEASKPIYDEETGAWIVPEENAQETSILPFNEYDPNSIHLLDPATPQDAPQIALGTDYSPYDTLPHILIPSFWDENGQVRPMEDGAQVIIPAVAGPEGTLIPLSEAGYSGSDSNIVAGIVVTENGSLGETPQILVPAIFDESGNLIVLTDPYTVEEPQVYLPGIVDENGNIITLTEADAIASGKFPLYIPYTVDESSGMAYNTGVAIGEFMGEIAADTASIGFGPDGNDILLTEPQGENNVAYNNDAVGFGPESSVIPLGEPNSTDFLADRHGAYGFGPEKSILDLTEPSDIAMLSEDAIQVKDDRQKNDDNDAIEVLNNDVAALDDIKDSISDAEYISVEKETVPAVATDKTVIREPETAVKNEEAVQPQIPAAPAPEVAETEKTPPLVSQPDEAHQKMTEIAKTDEPPVLTVPELADETASIGFGQDTYGFVLQEPFAEAERAQASSLSQLLSTDGKLYLPEPQSGAETADASMLPKTGTEETNVRLPDAAFEDRPQSSLPENSISGLHFALNEPGNFEDRPNSRDYPKTDNSTRNFTLPDASLSERAGTNFSGVPPVPILPPLAEADFGDRAQTAHGQTAPAAALNPHAEADFGDRAQTAHGQTAPAAALNPLREADFGDRAQTAHSQTAPAAALNPLREADFRDRAQSAHCQTAPAAVLNPLSEADFGDRAQTAHGQTAPTAALNPLAEADFGDRAQTAHGQAAPAAALNPLAEADFGDRAQVGATARPPVSSEAALTEVDMVDAPEDRKIALPPSSSVEALTDIELIEQPQSRTVAIPPAEKTVSIPNIAPQNRRGENDGQYAQSTGKAAAGTEAVGIAVEIYDTGINPTAYGAVESQTNVSIPVIRQLDKGSYYIQLGIYGTAAALQEAVVKIPAAYPLLTQSMGNTAKSSYRLLVGPLNEGESNASLLYFRRYGYKDAFIRKN
jgi:hypothetical protein